MIRILKQQLALLLVCAMVFSMLPVSALAEETDAQSAPVLEAPAETPLEPAAQPAPAQVSPEPSPAPAETPEPQTEAPQAAEPDPVTPETPTGENPDGEPVQEPSPVPEEAPAGETPENPGESPAETPEEGSEETSAEETAEAPVEESAEAPVVALFSARPAAADCAHAETEIAWDTNYRMTCDPVDDAQHRVSGYQYTYCTSCFDRVGDSFAAEELENHSLDGNGSCTLCGYGSGCAHKNTGTSWIWGSTPPRYSQYNDRQHMVTGYQYTYCSDCNESWEDDIVYVEGVLEDHYMRGGMCPYCSYSCPHTTTESVWDSDYPVTYSQYDSTHHKYQGYQYTYCTYCLERMGNSFAAEILEEHTLNDTGTCTNCRYSASCEHEIVWEKGDMTIYGNVTDTTHEVEYYKYPYCTKCEQAIGDSVRFPRIVEDHIFGENDICDICSYVKNCTHEDTYIDMYPATAGYESISDTQHVWLAKEYDYCRDCYKKISEDRLVRLNMVSDHTLDESGKCTACDYGSGIVRCAHENTQSRWDTNHRISYRKIDNNQHQIYGYRYEYCTDCQTRIGAASAVYDQEDHIFNEEDICIRCDAKAPAPLKLRVTLSISSYTLSIGDTILATASTSGGSGDYHYAWTIQHDGQTVYQTTPYFDRSISYTAATEGQYVVYVTAYDYDDLDAYGMAQSRSITVTAGCPHAVTEAAWDTDHPITYTQLNETQHTAAGYQYTYCTSCFERVGESTAVTENENHAPDAKGICTLCRYTGGCLHKNTEVLYYHYNPVRYEQVSEELHRIYRTGTTFCLDCRKDVGTTGEQAFSEEHTLTDGKCIYCGYGMGENYCTHPASEIMWDTNHSITYYKKDDTQHQVFGYQYHYCTSCYKRISESFTAAEYENHTFDTAGDCTLCDYRVGCTHSETKKLLTDTLYESIDQQYHEVTRLYSKVCADDSCGKVLVRVEPSYTETDEEKHTFDKNTCTLCKYTAADALTVTITSSAATANPGDRISASASVAGGTGGYKYSWKVLKDGAVVIQTDQSMGASYNYAAAAEGSYVFVVTVKDSNGNTATAQTTPITVVHVHIYMPITDRKVINQTLAHHDVVTTTYEECAICHITTEPVVDTVSQPHAAQRYSNEVAHPHQKFFVCECGAHPLLDGQFVTANGQVQDPAVCCVCHGHKFGQAQESADGSWKKTCASCGLTQKVAAPVPPAEPEEEHVHIFKSDARDTSKHPHLQTYRCDCKQTSATTSKDPNCCVCVGHDWGDVVRLPDGKTYKIGCFRCKTSQTVNPSSNIQDFYKIVDIVSYRHSVAKQYQDAHKIDSAACAIWKTIAGQATDKLTDVDFVTANETLNTFSSNASITGAIKAVNGQFIDPETWDDQQTDVWKTLLIQMLQKENRDESTTGIDVTDSLKTSKNVLRKISSAVAKVSKEEASRLTEKSELLRNSMREVNKKIFAVTDADSIATSTDMSYFSDTAKDKLSALSEKYNDDAWLDASMEADKNKIANVNAKTFGYFMDFMGVMLEGAGDAFAVDQYNKILADLSVSADNVVILDDIIDTAKAVGNTNLENAATELRDDIANEIAEQTNHLYDGAIAFVKGCIDSGLQWGVKELADMGIKALGGSLGGLGIVGLGAEAIKAFLGWGPVYDEAQMLMTLNQMDATMNITQVLKKEDSPYMAKLWGILQAEGCVYAQEFLDSWNDANRLDLEDLGIDDGGLFGKSELPKVLNELEEERDYYITALQLPLEKSD